MPDDPREQTPPELAPAGRSRSSVLLMAGAALLVAGHAVRWIACTPVGDDGSLTASSTLLAVVETGHGLGGLLASALLTAGGLLLLIGGVAKGVSLGLRERRDDTR